MSEFLEKIKELGVSLPYKSLESDSFRALIEEKDVGTNNPVESYKKEEIKPSDEQLVAVDEQNKIVNEASKTNNETVSMGNGQKEVEEITSDIPQKPHHLSFHIKLQ